MRELLRRAGSHRLDPSLRRLLRWWTLRWLIRVGAVALSIVLVGQVLMNARAQPRVPVEGAAPSRAELDAAIGAAEHYLDALYRPLPGGGAVVSEYYGLPLRVRIGDVWVRPGDPSLTIASGEQSRDRESYLYAYTVPGGDDVVELLVVLRWGAAGDVQLEVSQVGGADYQPLQVYVGGRQVADWAWSEHERAASLRLTAGERGTFRSLRYTIRHVAMLSELTYRYRGMEARADRLAATVDRAGYDVTGDVYSPLWGVAGGKPDEFMYDPAVYRDCGSDPGDPGDPVLPDAPGYYAYQSKVCTIPTVGYVAMSREDPLVPLVQALHVVQEHRDPEREFSDGEHLNSDPISVVAGMEARFREAGGIGECLPGSCEKGSTSTLRTVVFGDLEAELGLRYGDETSRSYADAVASSVLQVQVPPSGLIPTERLGLVHRPDQVGGFWTHVTTDGRSGEPDTFASQRMSDVASVLDLRPEYVGSLDTNAETTLVTYAFLVRYRCARYGTHCEGAPGATGATALAVQ